MPPMDAKTAAKRVLEEEAAHEHFFDFSDAERLSWMPERALKQGVLAASTSAAPSAIHCSGHRKRPMHNTSMQSGKSSLNRRRHEP